MSDHKGARLMLEALPAASHLIADRSDDSAWFRDELEARGIGVGARIIRGAILQSHWIDRSMFVIRRAKLNADRGSILGSDSQLMIFADEMALFSEGNQHHGEQIAFVVPDPGRIDCRAYRRGGGSYRGSGTVRK